MAFRLLLAGLLVLVIVQSCKSTLPQCFAATKCDSNSASCTIGFDCLGSLLTMCSFGDLQPNESCQTFPGTNTTYCACNSCIGLINTLAYTCSCNNAPAGLVCPTGTFVSCVPKLTGEARYACCGSANVC